MAIDRTKSATTEAPKARPVTFSPEELQRVIAQATAAAVAEATATLKAEMQAALAAKPQAATGGKSQSAKNEELCIKAFRKAGFGEVTPNVNVFTFNKWIEKGFRPIEKTKAVKVNNLRLFCQAQVRPVTKADLAQIKKQKADHDKRQQQAKTTASIHALNPQ
jgi:hypothetical protein